MKKMRDIPMFVSSTPRPSNRELIAELKNARKALSETPISSNHFGICWFLGGSRAGTYLTRYISKSLKELVYLLNWMRRNNYLATHKNTRRARLMWIDWMIASLENREFEPTVEEYGNDY